MRPFNLDEYLKDPSRKVVTRDGHEARILCTDRDNDNYPIIALYYNGRTFNVHHLTPICFSQMTLFPTSRPMTEY